ncbi:hypothetical protein N825_27135 [Skermanella stibiiresistens SB22]|uniref:DUF4055 domain-containing protein n=2 Tax=Skermanella TaxID=204447 RepID=W9GVE9_9PROT|nr:hypothetical protein N825_27135 [Skermanella stibiiresistens SB22]
MLAGADGVRSSADEFMPLTAEQVRRPEVRRAYIQRAAIFPATSRTLEATAGAVFRRDPTVRVPARLDARLENIDSQGGTLLNLAQTAVRETLAMGRFGILVDSAYGADVLNDPLAATPYLVGYTAENITNWRSRIVDGQLVLDQVVLLEHSTIPVEFGSTEVVQYRVLELDEQDYYRVRLFRQVASGRVIEVDRIEPRAFDRRRLDRLPFVFLSPSDGADQIRRSPLLDLTDCNLNHVSVAADLSNAIHKLSSPTLIVTGAERDEADVQLGGVVYLPRDTQCELLEFRGDGLGVLERVLDRLERQMAILGARLLEQPKRTAETAETTRLRQTSETSVLSSVSRNVSDGIKRALQIACDWDRIAGEVSFELNQDFLDSVMEPGMLEALTRSVQNGYLPVDDLYWNLRRGELLRPDLTPEQYRDELENNPLLIGRPSPLSLTPAPADPAAVSEDGP